MIVLNIHPAAGSTGAKSNLMSALRQGLSAPLFEPLDSLRYLLAALILLLSFVMGFAYFGRVSKTGIEAIGRNPLASRMIQLSIIMHIMITIVIVLIGFGMAYLILIL
jgi:F0F1-type ATP synthase membrane subunit c/vacuolar-type H+-ATPase subunit K